MIESTTKRDPLAAAGLVKVNGIVMTKAEAQRDSVKTAPIRLAQTKAAATSTPPPKADMAPLAKAIADQARPSGEGASSERPTVAVDYAAIKASWEVARAEMLASTGRA